MASSQTGVPEDLKVWDFANLGARVYCATPSNGGQSWNWAGLGLAECAPTWAMGRVGGSVLLGTSGGAGLFRSDDAGTHWTPSDWGLPAGGEAIAFGTSDTSVLTVLILRP